MMKSPGMTRALAQSSQPNFCGEDMPCMPGSAVVAGRTRG
jgi:hypothetical protein